MTQFKVLRILLTVLFMGFVQAEIYSELDISSNESSGSLTCLQRVQYAEGVTLKLHKDKKIAQSYQRDTLEIQYALDYTLDEVSAFMKSAVVYIRIDDEVRDYRPLMMYVDYLDHFNGIIIDWSDDDLNWLLASPHGALVRISSDKAEHELYIHSEILSEIDQGFKQECVM